ncbi:flavodoxin family protein [Pseudarthrobacter siccitolerans]
MKAAIVYESLYGNTHAIAEAIAQGLGGTAETQVIQVSDAGTREPPETDLLVVGGPTHIHGMSRQPMWELAVKDALEHPEKGLVPDSPTDGLNLRAWFASLDRTNGKAAAFDTRLEGNELLTGHASKGIAKQLRKNGFDVVAEPVSFLVDETNQLLPGELDRAREWGRTLGSALSSHS